MNIVSSYRESMREFKSLRTIILCALLIALGVVLEPLTIHFGPDLRQGVGFLPLSITGMMFGPFVGGITGAIGDIVKYMANPSGVFFPGYTLNEFLTGTLYGLIFYRQKITFARCFIVRFIIVTAINVFLTPLWITIVTGKGYWLLVANRVVKNIFTLAITTVMLYLVLNAWNRVWAKVKNKH